MEFNSINFNINNIANQKAGLVQNNQQQNQTLQQQVAPQTQQTQTQNINPSLMYDFQTARMDNETVLKYLQNLMNLPNSIDKFVNQLNSKNIDPKLSSLLFENLISIKALSEFLNKNSSEAISKLMQTISLTLKSGSSDVSQLKEIMTILGNIQNASSINTNTLKELLLLYIPLNAPVFDKNVSEKIESDEEQKAIKNSKLSILFETVHFSNILIAINEFENIFYLDVYSCADFAKQEFIRIINALSNEASITCSIDFKDKQKTEIANESQNFKIISDGFISPNLLILAHLIIKCVLKIDSDLKCEM